MKRVSEKTLLLVASLLAVALSSAFGQTLYVPGGTVGNSGNSNIGIATSNPTVRLDFGTSVANQKRIIGTFNTGNVFTGIGMDAATAGIRLAGDPSNNANPLVDIGYYSMDGAYTWTSRAFFASNGKVGFGTTSPAVALDVKVAPNFHFGAFVNTPGATSIGAFNDNFTAWQPLSINAGGQVWFMGGNVGIGTTTPEQRLTVKGGGIGFDGNASDKKLYSPADGVLEWMTHDLAGERAFAVSHQGTKRVYLSASGSSYFLGGNVGIGTASPTQKLSVNGTIRAKEVIIEASPWPDDVFAPGYALPTVDDVAAHIAAEGHLPGVPSAATVAEQGVAVGEMQKTLLRKVEELTLYVIAQEQRHNELRADVERLRDENASLRRELDR